MSVDIPNPFPLGIAAKQDSLEKALEMENVPASMKYTAEEWNKIIEALNYIYSQNPAAAQPTAIQNEYLTIAAMIADQGNQTTANLQWVEDASADPGVIEGYAYYEKLASSTGTLATDYRRLSTEEVTIIETGIMKVGDLNSNEFQTALKFIFGLGFTVSLLPGGGVKVDYAGSQASDSIIYVKTAADICNQVLDSTKIYRLEGNITINAPNQIIVPNDDLGLTIDGYGFNISSIFSSSPSHDIFVSPVGGSGDLNMSGFSITTIGAGSKVFNIADKNKDAVGNGTRSIEMEFINFSSCKDLGVIDGYRQFTGNVIGVYVCNTGLQLNGVWNGFRLGVTNSFGFGASGTFLKAGTGLLFKNRFFLNLNFDFPTGAVAADFSDANFESNELFQLNGCTAKVNGVFALEHAETLFPNISANSVKSLWTGNTGLPNTALEKLVQKLDTITTYNIDWFYNTYFLEMTGNTTFTESNLPANTKNTQEIKIYLDPKGFTPTFPAAWLVNLIGTIVKTELNEITLKYIKTGLYFMKINNSLSVYPAPSLQNISPVSLLPSQTQELVINGSFFTPATIVTIEGQTVNSIEFVNQGQLILSVTTGAVEDEFDITISNGTSVTFPNALIVNLGEVFVPTETDWTLSGASADVSENGTVKLTTYNTAHTAIWNTVQLDFTKDFSVRFIHRDSPLGLVSIGNGTDIVSFSLRKVSNGNLMFAHNIRRDNKNARMRTRSEADAISDAFTYSGAAFATFEQTFSTSVVGKVMEFRYVGGVMRYYIDNVLRKTFTDTLTENLVIRADIALFNYSGIKYIELP